MTASAWFLYMALSDTKDASATLHAYAEWKALRNHDHDIHMALSYGIREMALLELEESTGAVYEAATEGNLFSGSCSSASVPGLGVGSLVYGSSSSALVPGL